MFCTTYNIEVSCINTLCGQWPNKHADQCFHTQNASHCIVNARHRNIASLYMRDGGRVEASPIRRHHYHVNTGIDDRSTIEFGTTRNFLMRIPVANDEAIETH